MNLRIEKLIDPSVDAEGAAKQTMEPWCSVTSGPWAVFGTDDVSEATEFVNELRKALG